MPAKPTTHEPLIFAWNARDHSLWHLFVALLLLMGAMAGFFVVFRIVHPVAQRLPATPYHIISLDPADPAALALIHRAQDRSFALLGDADVSRPQVAALLAVRPSFDDYQLRLQAMPPAVTPARVPRLFPPGTDVLPPVERRVAPAPPAAPPASLHAVISAPLARRGGGSVELPGIDLTQPTRVQFRVAVGSAGQVITALPLSSLEDPVVMGQLHAAICGLHFAPSEIKRIEWGEVSFRWEAAKQQP
ncbi:MAG: hypothetical protein ACO1TE_27965 [Prosthecobacter sp.]